MIEHNQFNQIDEQQLAEAVRQTIQAATQPTPEQLRRLRPELPSKRPFSFWVTLNQRQLAPLYAVFILFFGSLSLQVWNGSIFSGNSAPTVVAATATATETPTAMAMQTMTVVSSPAQQKQATAVPITQQQLSPPAPSPTPVALLSPPISTN